MSRKQPNPASPVESKGWKRPSPTGVINKKHYWLVYYSHKDRGVHTEGHLILSTKHSYFNQANMNRVKEDIPKDALIVSVNYLGEMTEEEWQGETV